MLRSLSWLSAFAFAALVSGAVQAAPHGGYVAALAAPLATPRQEVVGGLLWKCVGDRCAAQPDGSRPIVVCQRVAKAFGPVAGFDAPGGALSSEELSRCNGQN